MPVHRIQLIYSLSDAKALHEWLSQWQSTKPTDTADSVVNDIPESPVSARTDTDAAYYRVSLSYQFSMAVETVFREPYEALSDYCEWHRIGYHACTHDRDSPDECSIDRVLADGSVPAYVPSLSTE
jgi:hypothetical protein